MPTFGGPTKIFSGSYLFIPLLRTELESVVALLPKKPERKTSPKRIRGQEVDSRHERARNYALKMEKSIEGQEGSKNLYAVACFLIVRCGFSIEEARSIFEEFNQTRSEPPWSDSDLDHKLSDAEKEEGPRGEFWINAYSSFEGREVQQFDSSLNSFEPIISEAIPASSPEAILIDTIDSPLIDPEDPLAMIGLYVGSTAVHDHAIEESSVVATPLPPLLTVPMEWMNPRLQDGRTDIANGKRLARIISGKAHYIPAWESWIAWDGKRWRQDLLAVQAFAKEVPATIIAESVLPAPVDFNGCNWGIKSASKARIEAMSSLVRTEPGVAIEHAVLDSNPWLLNCQNGTVDLRTGELKPHCQSDKITRVTPVKYNPDASTYEWDRFLEKILIDDGLIKHVQRLIGYCITGSTREQVLPIFWGEGSNGKSTLLDTLKAALGVEYASTAPPSLIIQKKNESHPTELAGLFGKRMVTAIETEKNQRLNEPLVKQLTGSDSISARRMRENFWEFRPTHKLILCTNHEPRVGDDFAIWRRLIMVPFTVRFWNPEKGETGPEELKRDNDLPKRLEQCLEGVLAWAVRGSVDWFKGGLCVDEKARNATEEYRKRQDVFGRFVEEVCLTGEQYSEKFSRLYDCFESWSTDNGERKMSSKAFGEWLSSNKFKKRSSGGLWILGITWKPEYDKTNTFESF